MFKIAICNDAEEINSQIEAFIHAYSLDSYKVDVFSDSYSLIQSLKNNDHMLYFLNIEKDNQGIEVAKTVRKYNLNAFIVFLANHKKYMSEIFEIRTFDYVLKP
ncbi:response regulator, partial [Enterococcus faecium]|nr:response regulator [Enterococcus faecium]NTQ42868.1 response regulator [Enterococcus faecium]